MASCAICDKPALFRCGKCKVERYCSRECQKDHWPHHKTRCPQLGAAARAAAEGASTPPAPEAPSGAPGHRRLEPQPPQLPLQPQPPLQTTAREHSGSFRGNPRASRLLGEIPPSLQPEAAAVAAVIPITRSVSGVGAGVGVVVGGGGPGGPGGPQGAAAGGCSAGPLPGAHEAGSGAGDVPETPPLSLPPLPSQSPRSRPSPQSPLGPRTPLMLRPAPPAGSPHPPAGRASMALVRAQLRESNAAAAAAAAAAAVSVGGGLQVEGRGGLLGSGSSPGRGGASILDRVLPPMPSTPTGAVAADVAADGGVGTSSAADGEAPQLRQQSVLSAPVGGVEGVAATAGTPAAADAGPSVASPSPLPQQQTMVWPWAARSADGGGGGAARPSSGAGGACLSDLPPEVVLEVLKALPARSLAAAAAVCRSWRRAAREPWLWVRQLCAAGYPLPAAAYVARRHAAPQVTSPAAEPAAAASDGADGPLGGARAVAGVRGIRAVRAVRAAGGSSHEDFLGGLRAGFLDRLQTQAQSQSQPGQGQGQLGVQGPGTSGQGPGYPHRIQPPGAATAAAAAPTAAGTAAAASPDLKDLYGRIVRMESNWRSSRYAEMELREHCSNVECLAFQRVEPWGSVLLSAAWDGSVRVFSLGPASGAPQQARCVRRYRGHTGWITCMAAGRHQVVTASTDRRVAAWRYYSESSDPWVALEHPQEVTLVRFCYAPPPPATTQYLAHQICQQQQRQDRSTEQRPGPDGAAAGAATAAAAGDPGTAASSAQSQWRSGQATVTPAEEDLGGGLYDSGVSWDGGRGTAASASAAALAMPYDPQWEDWVVTGCIDGVIRLWHLPTKQLLRTFPGHGDVVWGISVLYGSSVMVSSSRDGTTKLWQLPPYAAMQVAAATPPLPGQLGSAAAAAAAAADGGGLGPGPPPAAAADPGAQALVDAMATLCGHTSAILCMDSHRVPPGILSPPLTAARADDAADDAGDAGPGTARPGAGLGPQRDMLAVLAELLNTALVEPPTPAADADAGGGGGAGGVSCPAAAAGASGGGAAALPVWLVATGGADAVVRVWNLTTAQCHTTLRGHSVGVLSVQFGYLPRRPDAHRDAQLLPPSLDVSAAAPTPSLALPPGQYGTCRRPPPQRLPPSQRLVLVTGSVREVRVWDPVAGCALVALSDHSGPVTSVALLHGALVTLAMNDGLIVYKCNGMDGLEIGSGGGGAAGASGAAAAAPLAAAAASLGRPVSAAGRLRREVAAQRRLLEPVICMQDAPHHSFSAALAVQLEGLAVGSGTGDITYIDFRSRASPLPLLHARRRLQL